MPALEGQAKKRSRVNRTKVPQRSNELEGDRDMMADWELLVPIGVGYCELFCETDSEASGGPESPFFKFESTFID
jgi:hypothetical protein